MVAVVSVVPKVVIVVAAVAGVATVAAVSVVVVQSGGGWRCRRLVGGLQPMGLSTPGGLQPLEARDGHARLNLDV